MDNTRDELLDLIRNATNIDMICFFAIIYVVAPDSPPYTPMPISTNRITSFSMIITKLVTPRLQIITPPLPRRFGGAFVPLITLTATVSLLSGRMATPAITLPIVLVGCGPALPPNPPQDDPVPIPPPKGGGSGREPQIKIIMAA